MKNVRQTFGSALMISYSLEHRALK